MSTQPHCVRLITTQQPIVVIIYRQETSHPCSPFHWLKRHVQHQFFPSPASLRISSFLASASFCCAFAVSMIAFLRLSSSSLATVQTTLQVSSQLSLLRKKNTSFPKIIAGSVRREEKKKKRTWLIRLGVFLQLRHKFVKFLLSLLASLDATLLQLGIISLSQLVFGRADPIRKRRTTDGNRKAAKAKKIIFLISIKILFILESINDQEKGKVGNLLTPRQLCSRASSSFLPCLSYNYIRYYWILRVAIVKFSAAYCRNSSSCVRKVMVSCGISVVEREKGQRAVLRW